MDSNRKFINFKELLLTEEEETNPIVVPCRNIKRAEEILKTNQIDSPHQIILHTGIYDIWKFKPIPPFHIDRHLHRNKTHRELLSGVRLVAKNLFESIINKPMIPQKIQKILWQTKKPLFRYQSQPKNHEKEKPNIYPEKSYRSPCYQDTQQIKYWNTSPHNHRDTSLKIMIINQHRGSIAQIMNMHLGVW